MAFFLLLPLRTQEIMQESPMTAVYLRSPGLRSVKRIQPSALISGLIYPLLTPFSWTLYSSALNWQDGGKLWVTWGSYGAQGWKWIDWPFCVPVFLLYLGQFLKQAPPPQLASACSVCPEPCAQTWLPPTTASWLQATSHNSPTLPWPVCLASWTLFSPHQVFTVMFIPLINQEYCLIG